jgi:hypothetical protein
MQNKSDDSSVHGLTLLELKRVCGYRFAMTPSATQKAAESLYNSQAISYPRTETSFLILSEHRRAKATLANLANCSAEWKALVDQADPDYVSPVWVKSDAWYGAIEPLKTAVFEKMDDAEKNVFSVIAERYISFFLPNGATPEGALITEEEFEYRYFSLSRHPTDVIVCGAPANLIGPSFFIDNQTGSIWLSIYDHVSGAAWLEVPLSEVSEFIVSKQFESTAEFARSNMDLLSRFVDHLNNYVMPDGRGLYVCAHDVFETRHGIRYYKWPSA